jgi:mRNA-degrading endonuclease RelE of RelBE toxin-antitoxin system
MKTTKYKGITYQLDESKFKPAYIKFDQDMFDDEIYPVLVGLGFEVDSTEIKNVLVNNLAGNKYDFHVFGSKDMQFDRSKCHTAQQFLDASGIFAVADELPKDWYIEVTEDNLEELRKRVPKKIRQKMNYKITAEQAQSIVNIACENWKKKLAEKWANNIVLNKEIEISEEFYKEMRKACTEPQNKLFDKIFGEDGSVDLSEIYGLKLLVMSDNTLSIRDSGEYTNNAFYLTDNFNWELKRDSQEKLCLIPTKKNRGCHN